MRYSSLKTRIFLKEYLEKQKFESRIESFSKIEMELRKLSREKEKRTP